MSQRFDYNIWQKKSFRSAVDNVVWSEHCQVKPKSRMIQNSYQVSNIGLLHEYCTEQYIISHKLASAIWYILRDNIHAITLLYSYNFNPIKNTHLRHVTVHYFSCIVQPEAVFFPYWTSRRPIRFFFCIVHYVREVTRWFFC